MPSVTTPAVVLHIMPYRETSAIVRLLTRDIGVVSAVARGARRTKARTGPRLDLFTAGDATLFTKPHRDLHTLTAFEATASHSSLGTDVTRFAAGSALVELVLKCAPEEPLTGVFDAVSAGLSALENAPAELSETVALLAVWGLVVALGFAPSLDRCVVCGAPVEGGVAFSPEQGGALCSAHRRGERTASLKEADVAALASLVAGRLPEPLDSRHAAAHRRLLMGFIRRHLAEHRAMPALAFWDAEAWNVSPASPAAGAR